MWTDDADLDPSWAPPQEPAEYRPRSRRRILGIGIPVLAVVLVIATVWALGGFDYRDDKITDVAAGTKFEDGPFEFTFTTATIQLKEQFDDTMINEVSVYGTVRNTWDEALDADSDWFLIADPSGGDPKGATSANIFRKGDVPDAPSMVAPGLAAVDYQVQFELDKSTKAPKQITFGVGKLSYGNNSVFSTSNEETWDADNGELNRIHVPLKVLPADKNDY